MDQKQPYRDKLHEIFFSFSTAQIDPIISMVLSGEHHAEGLISDDFNENLESMILLLLESGDSALAEGATFSQAYSCVSQHYDNLQGIFPDIDPDFLTTFCFENSQVDFDSLVDKLVSEDYPKKLQDPLEVWEHLKQMLPNADPIYLRNHARVLAARPHEELENFIAQCIEKSEYPTMQEYLKDKEEFKFFTQAFNVAEYLQDLPDPLDTFLSQRSHTLLKEPADKDYALTFLYNQNPFHRKREIQKIFNAYQNNLTATNTKLRNTPKALRTPRACAQQELDCKNAILLKEILFLKHETAIRQFTKMKSETYRKAVEEAKSAGLLQTCNCCFNDELIPEECHFCAKNCIFCTDCIKRGTETAIGDGQLVFPCFSLNCDAEFSYETLQMVLDRKVFRHLFRRKQIAEIKKANIDGLETCPFCDFSMIPMEGDKVFKCQNVDCMKETCRECHHDAHIPLRCSEIEYDEDVKRRTYIEDKMTEALLRQCWKCSKKFYKESGCNKMTCSCGALMCYLCGKAIQDYSHFGETAQGKCALHSQNLQQMHLNEVLAGAQAAKNELGINNNPDLLKFDPTRGLQ